MNASHARPESIPLGDDVWNSKAVPAYLDEIPGSQHCRNRIDTDGWGLWAAFRSFIRPYSRLFTSPGVVGNGTMSRRRCVSGIHLAETGLIHKERRWIIDLGNVRIHICCIRVSTSCNGDL